MLTEIMYTIVGLVAVVSYILLARFFLKITYRNDDSIKLDYNKFLYGLDVGDLVIECVIIAFLFCISLLSLIAVNLIGRFIIGVIF